MLKQIGSALTRLGNWLQKSQAVQARSDTVVGTVDAFGRRREPSKFELVKELKNIAYACCMLNAQTCAKFLPKLYVVTHPGQVKPKCPTRPIPGNIEKKFKQSSSRQIEAVEEVTEHPILDLFEKVNPWMNGLELFELTTLYQEVLGSAYWLPELNMLGIPEAIWLLPSQHVRPIKKQGSTQPVDFYEYNGGDELVHIPASELIVFNYPDPRSPYSSGLSPLRAAYEHIISDSEYVAMKGALWNNKALPGVIISPEEVIGEDEAIRLEAQWNAKFRRGGMGRLLVGESKFKVEQFKPDLGDLAALAEHGVAKEDIANAFGVPMAMFTKETNLANLEASMRQHAEMTIAPKLRRRDHKLNEKLIPFYDPSGRLFFDSPDPSPESLELVLRQERQDLETGVRTINEVRAVRGLPPVPWGESPWLSLTSAPVDFARREDYGPRTGRNSDPSRGDSE